MTDAGPRLPFNRQRERPPPLPPRVRPPSRPPAPPATPGETVAFFVGAGLSGLVLLGWPLMAVFGLLATSSPGGGIMTGCGFDRDSLTICYAIVYPAPYALAIGLAVLLRLRGRHAAAAALAWAPGLIFAALYLSAGG